MTFLKITLVALLFIPSITFARIGETPDQCADRYGEPVATVEKKLEESDDKAERYLKDDVAITVEFKNGKAWHIRYEQRRTFNSELLEGLLSANVGGTKWEGPQKYDEKRFWITANKELHAVYNPLQGASRLVILNDDALKALESEREERMKLVGTIEADEWVDAFYGAPKAEGF